jgi:hypothetical protein
MNVKFGRVLLQKGKREQILHLYAVRERGKKKIYEGSRKTGLFIKFARDALLHHLHPNGKSFFSCADYFTSIPSHVVLKSWHRPPHFSIAHNLNAAGNILIPG